MWMMCQLKFKASLKCHCYQFIQIHMDDLCDKRTLSFVIYFGQTLTVGFGILQPNVRQVFPSKLTLTRWCAIFKTLVFDLVLKGSSLNTNFWHKLFLWCYKSSRYLCKAQTLGTSISVDAKIKPFTYLCQ